MTRRERLERKLERRQEWAEKADARSSAAIETARKITENIPFGQPILVGHHSEAGHRRAIDRSAAQMDKGVAEHRLAEHHRSKAEGLENYLENTIFDDDPDAVEKIEAKLAGLEKSQQVMVAANKICRNKKLDEAGKIAALVELGLSDENAKELLHPKYSWQSVGFQSYSLQNNNANIRRYRGRLESIKRRKTLVERAENAESGVVIDYICGGAMCRVTFAEKPERDIINILKAAGYRWNKCCWVGYTDKLPAEVKELVTPGNTPE